MYFVSSIEQFLAGKNNIEPEDMEFIQNQILLFDDCGKILQENLKCVLGNELANEFIEVCENNPLLKFGPNTL